MLKILLVDDDPDEMSLFNSALRANTDKKVQLVQQEDCGDVIGTIREYQPDLIFMDINMPAVDGIECLKRIRAQKDLERVPVVMYSTSKNEANIEQSFQNKANLYIVKPFNYADIVNLLGKVLNIDWNATTPVKKEDFVLR
jgi:CheY-like chemotaxis protein